MSDSESDLEMLGDIAGLQNLGEPEMSNDLPFQQAENLENDHVDHVGQIETKPFMYRKRRLLDHLNHSDSDFEKSFRMSKKAVLDLAEEEIIVMHSYFYCELFRSPKQSIEFTFESKHTCKSGHRNLCI